MRAELETDPPHEDARTPRQRRLPVPLLRDALLRSVDAGEAHAQVRRPAAEEGGAQRRRRRPRLVRPPHVLRFRRLRRRRLRRRRQHVRVQRNYVNVGVALITFIYFFFVFVLV